MFGLEYTIRHLTSLSVATGPVLSRVTERWAINVLKVFRLFTYGKHLFIYPIHVLGKALTRNPIAFDCQYWKS